MTDERPRLRALADSDPAAARFLEMLQEFLAEFGHRAPGEAEGKHDYWIVSERTRRPAKIAEASAVQMEQDLASVLP